MSETGHQLSLKSLGTNKPKETFPPEQTQTPALEKRTEKHATEEISIHIPSPKNTDTNKQPVQPGLADFAVPVPKASFLKTEHSPESVEISIRTRESKAVRKDPKSGADITKIVSIGVSLISLLAVGVLSWFIFYTGPFYTGIWKGELNEMEKSKGVKELSYTITRDSLTEKLTTDTEGLSITAHVTSKIEIVGEDTNTVALKKSNRTIKEINVSIPSILCQQTGADCEELKQNFEKTFRDEIDKQNKATEGATYRLTSQHSGRIKLESDVEAPRNLIRSK
jgi:hypothetical protein